MVVFILAAAAAFLLCAPFAPEQLSNWLTEKKHASRLIVFLLLVAAVLFILVAAVASPGEVGGILVGLPILSFIFFIGNVIYRLPTPAQPVPAEPAPAEPAPAQPTPERATQPAAVEWLHKRALSRLGHFVAFVEGKWHLVLLGLVVIAFLVPVALLVIPFGSFWFRPVAVVLAICTW